MDDVLVFAADKVVLHELHAALRTFVRERLGLELKARASRVLPVSQGIPFLGFRIFPAMLRVQRNRWVQFRRKVRKREWQYAQGVIDEAELAQCVASMIGHVVHADTLAARRHVFGASLALG